jgi:hypothetical protein
MTNVDHTGTVDQTQQTSADDQLASIVAERDQLKQKLRELGKDSEILKTLRGELASITAEKSKLYEEFTGFKETVRKKEVDTHVTTALVASGARNPTTVQKLLDQAKIKFGDDGQIVLESVAEMINAVKASDPYLFTEAQEDPKKGNSTPTTGTSQVPDVKRAADTRTQDAFETELQAARKAKDPYGAIEAVLKKYRK